MTYEHDYERSRMTGSGVGGYQTSHDTGTGIGKWILISVAVVLFALGAAAVFSGDATLTYNDGGTGAAQTETTAPAPAPATE